MISSTPFSKPFRKSVPPLFLALLLPLLACAQTASPHLFFRVTLDSSLPQPASGRLLIFLTPAGGPQDAMSQFRPSSSSVAAKEISHLLPGSSVDVDVDDLAFPGPFSSLKPGSYQAHAILDVSHTYVYDGANPGDIESPVVSLTDWTPGSGPEPTLTLNHVDGPPTPRPLPLKPEELAAAEKSTTEIDFVSPALTAFSGRETHIRGWVVLPPGYADHPREHYPTVYWTHGFGANLTTIRPFALMISSRMNTGKIPPMIWIFLDESLATGTHEFADSVNNGPWGHALTAEFIPFIESKYRMDARPSGRFLQGHSSGGWATLQLQVNYPTIFGGTWSTSPDPSDFHDFSAIDLYAPHANVYRKPDGTPCPIVRDHAQVLATFEEFAHQENVLGPYGGQVASFEWVFSPRGPDGRPLPMFDRATGDVNPAVVQYWHDHYDLAHLVEANWATRGRDLKGRIHLVVGTADTFYLDGAAHKFEAVLSHLGGDPHFTFRDNRTHFDLYEENGDRMAMMDEIAEQMYAVARPSAHWTRPAGSPPAILH